MTNTPHWTVLHNSTQASFESFQRAISYADRLASGGKGVKLINLETLTIDVQPTKAVHWGGAFDEQLSATARDIRAREIN
ncbi:MAG TPA: hypothetical protein V6C86_26215 [Oculatellaceae cyanobacterium]